MQKVGKGLAWPFKACPTWKVSLNSGLHWILWVMPCIHHLSLARATNLVILSRSLPVRQTNAITLDHLGHLAWTWCYFHVSGFGIASTRWCHPHMCIFRPVPCRFGHIWGYSGHSLATLPTCVHIQVTPLQHHPHACEFRHLPCRVITFPVRSCLPTPISMAFWVHISFLIHLFSYNIIINSGAFYLYLGLFIIHQNLLVGSFKVH